MRHDNPVNTGCYTCCVVITTIPIILLGLWLLLIFYSFGVAYWATAIAWGIVFLCCAWLFCSVLRFFNPKNRNEEGLATKWHKNGRKASEATFKDGKLEGLATNWDNQGKVVDQTCYKDGVEVKE